MNVGLCSIHRTASLPGRPLLRIQVSRPSQADETIRLQAWLMNQIARFTEPGITGLPNGSVEVVTRLEAMRCRHWANAFGSEAKDCRYYELVEDTIHAEFDYRYFALRDWKGEISGIQPFFI